jgi:hypothetical protein
LLEKFDGGKLTVAAGGTGVATPAETRAALGLGSTTGALPVLNGGTGATDAPTARAALGAQQTITATGNTNLLTAPATAGAQPGTKPITDFALQSNTYTKTEIDNAYATKNAIAQGSAIAATTYRNISPIERHIYCNSFMGVTGTNTVYIRLCPRVNHTQLQLELAGRYVYTTVPLVFYYGYEVETSLTKRVGTVVASASYSNLALSKAGDYIWLRVTTTDPQLNNLCIKIILPQTTDSEVIVTTTNPGGTWVSL